MDGYLFNDESRTSSLIHAIHSKRCTEQGIEGISRLPALSFSGTSQGRGAGEPDQTVAGPFAELDGPLRRAITVRRGHIVANGARKLGWDLNLGDIGLQTGSSNSPVTRRVNLS